MDQECNFTTAEEAPFNGPGVMFEDIEKLICRKIDIPSPPKIVVRILEAVQEDESCFAELGKIISADPALTAKMLKVANSSLYGFSGRVKTIEGALAILGINTLKNIALSFIIVNKMQGRSDEIFDFEYFWKRSVTAAVAAQLVSGMLNGESDDVFVSGLLQDIGVLVMFHDLADDYIEVLSAKSATGVSTALIEKRLIGFNHCELGSALLKKWGLPKSIYLPVFFHHTSQGVPERYRLATDILNLSNKLSAVYHSPHSAESVQEIFALLTEKYAIAEEVVKETIDTLADQSREILDFFDIDPGKMRPFSEMLQEANQELGKLNFSYEHMVVELKRAQDESKRYLDKLIEANRKYREMAYRDELTGLYNHRYYQEIMEKELERIKRYQRGLSLLFFDIDYFKEINDSYGHVAGDQVLKCIARRIQKIKRSADVVVRYGGDEFAVIMPETDRKGLQIFAERIRRGIESLAIEIDGESVNVTISIGAAVLGGGKSTVDKVTLLEAADKAIYLAKRAGRNKVHIFEID
jgi:diguanylate cyclase (GGDEF)-like protein